ncbi:hypothetical protein D9M73_270290 [compost metagenome]
MPFIEGITQIQHRTAWSVAFAVLQGDPRAYDHMVGQAAFDQALQTDTRAAAAASGLGQGRVWIDFQPSGGDLAE